MKLIVGLGNPGEKYKYTRHNIGFMVVEKLAKELLPVGRSEKAWKGEGKFSAEICKLGEDLILAKPMTYMNGSGSAVRLLKNFYKLAVSDIWVVQDDIDLPLGKIRIRRGGASAGHHGIDSIISDLHDSEFFRFRLGIGRGRLSVTRNTDQNLHRREVEKYVLSLFSDQEGGEMKKIIKRAVEALDIALKRGIDKAMNRFN